MQLEAAAQGLGWKASERTCHPAHFLFTGGKTNNPGPKKVKAVLQFTEQVKGRGRQGLGVHTPRPVGRRGLQDPGLEGTETGGALRHALSSLGSWGTDLPGACFTRKPGPCCPAPTSFGAWSQVGGADGREDLTLTSMYAKSMPRCQASNRREMREAVGADRLEGVVGTEASRTA